MKTICSTIALVLLCATTMAAGAQETAKPARPAAGSAEQPAKPARKRVVYNPPPVGGPITRAGGGTRASGAQAGIELIAPKKIGRTSQAQPAILYFVNDPIDADVVLTLIDDKTDETVLEHRDRGPLAAGIHEVDLAKHNVQLRPDTTYQVVAVVKETATNDARNPKASAWLQRIDDPALKQKLGKADKADLPALYAESGYWYDAQGALADQIAANPKDATLHETRAELLSQEELRSAAEYERNAAKTAAEK